MHEQSKYVTEAADIVYHFCVCCSLTANYVDILSFSFAARHHAKPLPSPSPGEIELDLNRLLCPARTASDCSLAQLDKTPEDTANNNNTAIAALTDSLRRRKKEE